MLEPVRIDRRTTLKWVLAASGSLSFLKFEALLAATGPGVGAGTSPARNAAGGYGTDPNLLTVYRSGELWPLTLNEADRRTTAALCDVIIPADALSPSASAVGVVDFIDEWISAPYAEQRRDRELIVTGLAGLEKEAQRHFDKGFADLNAEQQHALCDPICYAPKAASEFKDAASFFARFRDLTAGGFYTTPAGTKDLGFVGNVALARFDGPPLEVLQRVGLANAGVEPKLLLLPVRVA